MTVMRVVPALFRGGLDGAYATQANAERPLNLRLERVIRTRLPIKSSPFRQHALPFSTVSVMPAFGAFFRGSGRTMFRFGYSGRFEEWSYGQ